MLELREYQDRISDKAVELLEKYKIAYLSMEVRTGKTITSLAIASKGNFNSVLFITRKKAMSSILADYEHFKHDFKLELINYESVHKLNGSYDFIIIDEAHSLGAFPKPSLRTKRIRQIANNKPILYLSGTPTPESYSQIYHQFWVSSFSPFKKYYNFYKWANDYVKIGKIKTNFGFVNDYKKADIQKIEKEINHLFISFTQKEAGFEQYEVKQSILQAEPPEHITNMCDILVKNNYLVFTLNGKEHEVAIENALSTMQKINQLASGTIKVDGQTMGVIVSDYKLHAIKKDMGYKKIAIYYKYQAEKKMIIDFFGKNKIVETPEEFNNSEDKIFIGQLRSAREGINLKTGDIIYILTPDFSSTTHFQVLGRMQHKERKEQAELKYVIGTKYDKHIHKVVLSKKDYTLRHFREEFIW